MNFPEPIHELRADEQASLWAARLADGSLSSAHRFALEAWLAENPAHRALLDQYRDMSDNLGEQLPVLVEAGVVPRPAPPPKARISWTPAWIGVSSLAAAAIVALGLWLAPAGRQIEHLAANAGQRQSFTLTDGTQVELNARTRLQVETSRGERRVSLVDGEAYFVVSKDPSRPFIVETPAGSVRVTGTVFNVRHDPASVLEVTVVEGSVEVRPSARAARSLTANDRLVANAQRVTVQPLSAAALADALAWRHGKIFFTETPLREALARVAHHHGRTITLSPAADQAGLEVGGMYGIDDFDAALADIAKGWNLRITPQPNGAVRVSLLSER